LLKAGGAVFGQRGFRQASVAEICRRSRVANGTFYQYFVDKEHIFLKLVERMTSQLQARLQAAVDPAAPALEQIKNSVRAHLELIGSQTALYRVFREAEFLQPDLPHRLYGHLADFYQHIVQEGQNRGQLHPLNPETVAFALIGLTEFIALRYWFWDRQLPPRALKTVDDFLAHGLSSSKLPAKPTIQGASSPVKDVEEPLSQGQRTRARLLTAAEGEFGQKGFYDAQIVDIARRAGVAHGTFYTYFPSKEAMFIELVHEINGQLRAHARAATENLTDRREIECAGFRAFFDFIQKHSQAYRIVREAEFVGPPSNTAGRWYYERLARGYIPALAQAMAARQIRELDPEALSYALMGIGHFIGLRWVLWEKQPVPERVFESMMDFILGGLSL
jgi:AcrR family transcriptional regulator